MASTYRPKRHRFRNFLLLLTSTGIGIVIGKYLATRTDPKQEPLIPRPAPVTPVTQTDNEEAEVIPLLVNRPGVSDMWVPPLDGGACPLSHQIKARFSTGRYHLPEDAGYEKIVADCCYSSAQDAEADGFTHTAR